MDPATRTLARMLTVAQSQLRFAARQRDSRMISNTSCLLPLAANAMRAIELKTAHCGHCRNCRFALTSDQCILPLLLTANQHVFTARACPAATEVQLTGVAQVLRVHARRSPKDSETSAPA